MNENYSIKKYPRTQHLEGSRLQQGDEDLCQIPFSEILGRHIVIEEKIDGANTAISFDTDGTLLLQSRGHYLTGGGRERHYNLLKQWATLHSEALYNVLGKRYIMYGEWMYAKHTVYYNALTHYFIEFDIFDRDKEIFLDTASRKNMISTLPVVSAPVLAEGIFKSKEEILGFLGKSNFIKPGHMTDLYNEAKKLGLNPDYICGETDSSEKMEGLYIKTEENGQVTARIKYVRASFLQAVDTSGTHWQSRPIVPNKLCVTLGEILE